MSARPSLWLSAAVVPLLAAVGVFACSGTITPGDEDGGLPDSGLGQPDGGSDAGPDGGTPDAGDAGSDAGADAGFDAGGDAGCPYLYCEDFDTYTAGALDSGAALGPWVATVQGQHTNLAIDPSGGYGGSQALRITIVYTADAGSARGTLNQHTDGGALVGSTLYGRAEIFYAAVGDDAGLPLNVHSWIFNASGRIPDGGATSMNLGGGGNRAQLNYQYPPGPKYPDGGPYRLPDGSVEFPTEASAQGGTLTTGAWHCLQWQYGGPPANIGNVWIDGTPAITVNDPTPATNWLLSDAYSSFDFGFTHYQNLINGIDLYLDNFALDSQRIPCP